MSDRAAPVYLGIIVSALDRSLAWYCEQFDVEFRDRVQGSAMLRFPDDSEIELIEGDRSHPGLSFPSYGNDGGPPLLPGYGCIEPDETAEGLTVVRRLPDWIVVVAPDGLRVVLTDRDSDAHTGLVGFRFGSPQPEDQRSFFERIGSSDTVGQAGTVSVLPVIAADRDATLEDPDGTTLVLVRDRPGA